MIVLLGEFNGKSKVMPYLERHGWGRMWSSYGPAWSYPGEPWGFDNGAWSAYKAGTKFDGEKFERRMYKAMAMAPHPPVVAAVPDIVGDGLGTLGMALEWRRQKLPNSWPWYLVVQDDVCPVRYERELLNGDYAGVFLGGTDDVKRQASYWCRMAHANNKKFHWARCGREQWYRKALEIGADSIDSTRMARAYTGGEMGAFRLFEQVVTGRCQQQVLFA